MKSTIFGLFIALIASHATPAVARELVCNNGALVIRENPLPKKDRRFPDPDIIATVYDEGVVRYLESSFGYSGDGGYGRTTYHFDSIPRILKMHFFEDAALLDPQLSTSGKFSNVRLQHEGHGIRLILSSSGRSTEWFFENCGN